MQVFENFTYRRQLASDDGLKAVLELSAQVNGKHLKGIDIAQINDDGDGDGQGVDFEVMLRPRSGLQALGEEMGRRMAPYRALLKGESSDECRSPSFRPLFVRIALLGDQPPIERKPRH